MLNLDTAHSYTKFLLNHGLRPKLTRKLLYSTKNADALKVFYAHVRKRFGVPDPAGDDLKSIFDSIMAAAKWKTELRQRFGKRKLLVEKRAEQVLAMFNLFYCAYLNTEVLITRPERHEDFLFQGGRLMAVREGTLTKESTTKHAYASKDQRSHFDNIYVVSGKVTSLNDLKLRSHKDRIQTVEQMGLALFEVVDSIQAKRTDVMEAVDVAHTVLFGPQEEEQKGHVFNNVSLPIASNAKKRKSSANSGGGGRKRRNATPKVAATEDAATVVTSNETKQTPAQKPPSAAGTSSTKSSTTPAKGKGSGSKSPFSAEELAGREPKQHVESLYRLYTALTKISDVSAEVAKLHEIMELQGVIVSLALSQADDSKKKAAAPMIDQFANGDDIVTVENILSVVGMDCEDTTAGGVELKYDMDIGAVLSELFNEEEHGFEVYVPPDYNNWRTHLPRDLLESADEDIFVFKLEQSFLLKVLQILWNEGAEPADEILCNAKKVFADLKGGGWKFVKGNRKISNTLPRDTDSIMFYRSRSGEEEKVNEIVNEEEDDHEEDDEDFDPKSVVQEEGDEAHLEFNAGEISK